MAAAAAKRLKGDGQRYWLRASKLLADVGWTGTVFRLYVHTTDEVHTLLARSGINQIYLENDRTRPAPGYAALLQRAIDEAPDTWHATTLAIAGSDAKLFRRRDPLPAQPVTFYLRRLHRNLGEYDTALQPR